MGQLAPNWQIVVTIHSGIVQPFEEVEELLKSDTNNTTFRIKICIHV